MKVAVCTAVIPKNCCLQYQQYWNTNNEMSKARKQGMVVIKEAIMNSHVAAIGIPDVKHVKPNYHDVAEIPTSINTISLTPSNKRGRYSIPLPTG
jgi:hypothetical protein